MSELVSPDQVEIPAECFDSQGQVACFLCERWPVLLVPATREAEAVLAAWVQHITTMLGLHAHPARPVLATLTSPVHAWQWPTS